MNDITVHIALFLLISAVIVLMATFYAEPDDKQALSVFPRRYLTFMFYMGMATGVLLIAEHTLASVS